MSWVYFTIIPFCRNLQLLDRTSLRKYPAQTAPSEELCFSVNLNTLWRKILFKHSLPLKIVPVHWKCKIFFKYGKLRPSGGLYITRNYKIEGTLLKIIHKLRATLSNNNRLYYSPTQICPHHQIRVLQAYIPSFCLVLLITVKQLANHIY